jgi:hypothetical protein
LWVNSRNPTAGIGRHNGLAVDSVTDPMGESVSIDYDGPLVTGLTWSGEVAGSMVQDFNNDLIVDQRCVNGAHFVSFGYDDLLLETAGALTLTRNPDTGFVDEDTLGSVAGERTYNDFAELDFTMTGDCFREKVGRLQDSLPLPLVR